KYIEPTILTGITEHDPIMQEEIFGPLLPVMEYQELEEVIRYINKKEKPLALYFFGSPSVGEKVLKRTSSGGACINDTLLHIGNHKLPFGGVGNSGMGRYHGKYSFDAFSHQRSVVKSSTWIDLPFKYIPHKYIKLVKRLL
ncbi:MAG: aldehyde dehydrogenase family protein, partial [Bacteroidales bacterium]